jgi:small ligand-binding sensory domain FIST
MMTDPMLFASATTTEQPLDRAVQALVDQIKTQTDQTSLDFGLVFLSPHFIRDASQIGARLQTAFQLEVLMGCTGEGVIGRDEEIEDHPAITFVAARLPEVELAPFALEPLDWRSFLSDPAAFKQVIAAPNGSKLFVLLADPFSVPMDELLAAFNTHYAGIPIIGGMASGSESRGGNVLIMKERLLTQGVVGLAFAGSLEVDVIVSQGCRPVGEPLTVTAVKQNMIYGLDGESPLLSIQRLVDGLSEVDQALLRQYGLLLGRAIEQGQETLGRGDFLIRGVLGVDERNGAIAVGDYFEDGETVQFHLRDASTAIEDLQMMLSPQMFFGPPSGAMLFSCNGRGTRLYNRPNVDISTIQGILGDVNLAGFFCAGEIGPVGGKNFLHGHTASMVLFRPEGSAMFD